MTPAASSMRAISSRGSRAYVSFLAGDGNYVKGVIALAKSLRRVQSAYPFIVAVLEDVPEEHRELLRWNGCHVRPIDKINLSGIEDVNYAQPHYVINYSKLRIWLFEDFEKLIYLDADVAVFDNIDHLFDLPSGRFYAVQDCFCATTWSHTPQYKVKYCQQSPESKPWPRSLGPPPPAYFNAGMFVFEPGKFIFEQMMYMLLSTPLTPFAEQDSLNAFFSDMYTPLPMHYNLILAMLLYHPEKVPDIGKIKVVHYCVPGSKPWSFRGDEEHMNIEPLRRLIEKWWNVYEDRPIDYPALIQQSRSSTQPIADPVLHTNETVSTE
ncbi:hypothetical protein KP509_01G033600 [Ceratopteris richardii]|uniref:Hexosyltransferase n=1 Tax=Ceratopteris richardii TaxID=49495 RepID=A0A8T2VG07_CERRI|nr:hypothetical protein KP509_01G033600 [Ceratopteris richardii]